MKKIAFITGINGQDGSYLTEFLLNKGYDIHGLGRRSSLFNRSRIEATRAKAKHRGQVFKLYYGDLGDPSNLYKLIYKCKPTEIYNFASQSHVAISFEEPEHTTEVNANGVLRLLEIVKFFSAKECRFYQASTSELFGIPQQTPQTEETPFHPRSPYGVAKLYAYWIVKNYREYYGMHASNGLLYNHESPRRGENFVTRKITYSLARIKAGEQDILEIGNLDSRRDWGFAGDYVKAMWLMLQMDEADDYVIATGKTHSVRDFIELASKKVDYEIEWEGSAEKEIGRDKKSGEVIVKVNPKFFRPLEDHILIGDFTKAKTKLNWKPEVTFEKLVSMMMEKDMKRVNCSS